MKTYEFTGGKPPPESFPVQGLIEASERVLRRWGRALVYYPQQPEYAGRSNKGYLGLREVASNRFAHREGSPLPVKNIALTSGSMQAIELIGRSKTLIFRTCSQMRASRLHLRPSHLDRMSTLKRTAFRLLCRFRARIAIWFLRSRHVSNKDLA